MLIYSCILVTFAIACLALFRPFERDRKLLNAFNALELEFDDLREHMQSALGRVSRLRAIMKTEPKGPDEPAESVTPITGAAGSSGLSPHQTMMQARILARRKGGTS